MAAKVCELVIAGGMFGRRCGTLASGQYHIRSQGLLFLCDLHRDQHYEEDKVVATVITIDVETMEWSEL